MALRINWEIEGERQISRVLREVDAAAGDWFPAYRESAKELEDVFQNQVFASRGSIIGERWAPLAPSTVEQKRRRGFSSQPLVATGNMQNSFTSLVQPDRAVIWNTTEYFKYHQSNKPRFRLPRRVMMKLGHIQRELVIKIFVTHFQKNLRNIS